jgi:hypothetical protein
MLNLVENSYLYRSSQLLARRLSTSCDHITKLLSGHPAQHVAQPLDDPLLLSSLQAPHIPVDSQQALQLLRPR